MIEKKNVELKYVDDTSKWLEEQTGERIIYGRKPTMLDLADKIKIDENTPVDVLMAIIGKALMRTGTNREWVAYKYLCSYIAPALDQAIEIRTFVDTH